MQADNDNIHRDQESSVMNFNVSAIKSPLDGYQLFLLEIKFARQMLTNQNSSKISSKLVG